MTWTRHRSCPRRPFVPYGQGRGPAALGPRRSWALTGWELGPAWSALGLPVVPGSGTVAGFRMRRRWRRPDVGRAAAVDLLQQVGPGGSSATPAHPLASSGCSRARRRGGWPEFAPTCLGLGNHPPHQAAGPGTEIVGHRRSDLRIFSPAAIRYVRRARARAYRPTDFADAQYNPRPGHAECVEKFPGN